MGIDYTLEIACFWFSSDNDLRENGSVVIIMVESGARSQTLVGCSAKNVRLVHFRYGIMGVALRVTPTPNIHKPLITPILT